jgi:hypothetical protein
MSRYEDNRARFPLEELQRYAGLWVAFSADGSRIIDSAETLAALEERLNIRGEDAQNLAFEYLEFEDNVLGGAELL